MASLYSAEGKINLDDEASEAVRKMLVDLSTSVMSEKNRPNLHAVGLLVDIIESLEKRVRGPALEFIKLQNAEHSLDKEKFKATIFPMFKDEICKFIETIDKKLNQRFGK